MRVLAIDPGPIQSAYVVYDNADPRFPLMASAIHMNDDVIKYFATLKQVTGVDTIAVEMVASYGMAVGREVFETCVEIGRMIQAWPGRHKLIYRKEVKMNLCGMTRATDSNVRQALIDRFGGSKEKAIGVKAAQGPLYGIKSHLFSALAVAVTFCDLEAENERKRKDLESGGLIK